MTQLVQAFVPLGLTLDPDGSVRQTVIDNLSGTELTAELRSYVDRINSNPDDAPLQVGTGKELDEAAARHVLKELLGDYSVSDNFPVTLTSAFTAIGMATPTELPKLDPDPHRAVHQCLFLLATAVNRLRNDAGTGHGKPDPPRKTAALSPAEARLVARATALVAGALLDKLDGG
ncbi:abortive infection family protein [Mycolicibacterium hodleri]|uniref:abortive infection family protein n=1 Tax=Mycolicibacterium hodleri TaxID=49897 RepID=UPI001F1C46F0|nr:abortive infection family protein [Mycolicibacterium hodleri]